MATVYTYSVANLVSRGSDSDITVFVKDSKCRPLCAPCQNNHLAMHASAVSFDVCASEATRVHEVHLRSHGGHSNPVITD